ncbi:MAG: 50S ribosomal protein L35 [Candidatus Gastranaerophilales bacterium]|nr:50S ribosomal protein L35 [Candidatus Gastranaerophilales bacterium]
MPKMKTHRAGAKRYKVTANGKILRRKAGKSHLLEHKTTKQKRSLSGMTEVAEGNIKKIKLELPYIKYSR